LVITITSLLGIFVYIILWISVPIAVNTAQRLEVRSQEVIVKNIDI